MSDECIDDAAIAVCANHERTVRDSTSIPSAPANQNLRRTLQYQESHSDYVKRGSHDRNGNVLHRLDAKRAVVAEALQPGVGDAVCAEVQREIRSLR